MPKIYTVSKDYDNCRFDRWFKQNIGNYPQALIERLIRKKKIRINRKKIKTSYRVSLNDKIEIYDIENLRPTKYKKIEKYKPSKSEKKIYDNFIIEDNDNFLVINKPSGIPVQAGTKSFKNIIDILRETKYFLDAKPFIVHRLDKETSGVMIIAKNREYAQLFTSLFRIRKIHKTYLAITHGRVNKDINILRDKLTFYENNKKVVQKAISYLKILRSNDKNSFLELKPITGRKHQLRKQLFNIGNPIIGDNKYSFRSYEKNHKFKNIMLHAYKIKFMINNVKYNFEAQYSDDFNKLLKAKF
ncbi:MAG: RNA pseudouridine synthase [Candidatus Pelagibacter sp. TMED196]|nr:MAG: RNA pseudouridine synthase [Candidatus Pelagibacter sp. TMED196]|tara:strand:- start:3988 stop:4890 length:903 start_codon:yes stop_codon:yes gene_type:complete